MDINKKLNEIVRKDKEFFDEAFRNVNIPDNLRKASERICFAYGIRGICDPLYIANVIANELGIGDGKSNFYKTN